MKRSRIPKGLLSSADRAFAGRLQDAKPGRTHQSRHGTRSHIDIVSTSLCDDVIDRLGPSLRRHKGCDLIDINPGAGLFSEKLHNFLRPRTHLLVEPESHYDPFLKPLVEKPGSRYRRLALPVAQYSTYQAIVNEGHLPQQERLREGDPRLHRPNDSLLLVANLAFHSGKGKGDFASAAGHILYRLLSDIQTNATLQSYGLMRMLVWIADNERATYLPRTVVDRRKTSVEVEMVSESITEVASADTPTGHKRRDKQADILSAKRVLERTTETGVVVPRRRKSSLQREVEAGPTTGSDDTIDPATSRIWHAELAKLKRLFAEGVLNKYTPARQDQEPVRSKEYDRMMQLKAALATEQRYQKDVQKLLDQAFALEASEDGLSESLTEDGRAQAELRLASERARYDVALQKASKQVRALVNTSLDDRRALRLDPPLLMWDRRTVEPLILHSSELFPQAEPALLDFQPKPLPEALRQNADSHLIFNHLAGSLFAQPARPLPAALDTLAWGAADALTPEVSALTDATRGGRRDVQELTVRMLTAEMFEGLVRAWEGWLFKPTTVEAISRVGAGSDKPRQRAL